jgi:ribosomal protein S18 acetylase RimI-like enzyme
MEFLFTSDGMDRRADEILNYLRGPRLWIPHEDYPDFDGWLQKVHSQLKDETKRALVALSRGNVIGAVIYQRHMAEPTALEIKNITVRPDMRGRHIASFLVRNVEVEGAREFGVRSVLVDAKVGNLEIRTFLFGEGYRIQTIEDLYGLGAGEDVLYRKSLS